VAGLADPASPRSSLDAPVQLAAGQPHETVHLIDWEHPEQNDFALAEEVTLRGGYERRPDIVLYIKRPRYRCD